MRKTTMMTLCIIALLVAFSHAVETTTPTATTTAAVEQTTTTKAGEQTTTTAVVEQTITTKAGEQTTTTKAGEQTTTTKAVEQTTTTKAGEQTTAKAGEQTTAKAGEQTTAKAGEQATTKAGEKATTKAGEKATTKAGEKATTKAGEKATTAKAGEKAGSGSGSGVSKPSEDLCTVAQNSLKAFLNVDPSKAHQLPKETVRQLCGVFASLPAEQQKSFALCSEDLGKAVKTAENLCGGGAGSGSGSGSRKPDDPNRKCENPVAVTDTNCKKENILKVTDKICAATLVKDCIKGNKQDCGALTSSPSAESCARDAIKSSLKGKPECLIPLRNACKTVLQKIPKTKSIPQDCTSWFDGCNECTVSKGQKSGCSKKFCGSKSSEKAFCKAFESGKKCFQDRATGKSKCDKEEPAGAKLTCEDVTSDLDLSPQQMCVKASTLCGDKSEFEQNCEAQRENDAKDKCKALGNDKKDEKKKAYCCVQGFLDKAACGAFGSSDTLPSDCKTRCVVDGKLKASDKTCVRCRGSDDLRPEGVSKDDKDTSKPFDPARVKDSIKKVASGLNAGGKKCFQRIAQAASKLKTSIQRWRNDPTEDEESAEQVDLKSVADVQSELEAVAEESESLENEFADDDKGKNYRKDNEADTLTEKMSDDADKKPKSCGTEFAALRKAYNDIVDEYVGLPAKLKTEAVERVPLSFSDIDIGSTNIKDSKSVCNFAKTLVGRLKNAEDNHKKRLAAARKLVCTKAGELVKSKAISTLFTCLQNAKKTADAGSDQTAKDDANKDITNFNNNGYKRIQKLLKLTTQKCVMKDTPDSKKARVKGLFRETLKTKIKRKAGATAFSDEEKGKIADEINEGVRKKYPQATNIETTFSDSSSRRQLRPRRVLSGETTVSTTYDLDTPPTVGDKVEVQLTDADVVSSESSFEPTSGSIEVSESVTEIDSELPTGEDTTTTALTTKAPTTTPELSTGAKEVVFGTAAAICATILLV